MKRFALSLMIILFAAGGYTAFCAAADTGRILPGTMVNDINISGMTQEEAAGVLKDDAAARRDSSEFTVSFEDQQFQIDVRDALVLDYEAAAREAFEEGHSPFFKRGLARIKSYISGSHIDHPPVSVDAAALHDSIEASGLLNAATAVKDTYHLEEEKLILTTGAAKKPDEEGLKKRLILAVQTKDFEQTIPCPAVANDIENLEQIYKEVHTEPQNATLDRDNGYTILKAVTGVDFDKENAKKILLETKDGDVSKIDLTYTQPEISTSDLKEHLFADNLSSYATKVTGRANRLTNVSLAAQKCDGTILLSGEEFSFNGTVGVQNAQTGFKKAGATLNGRPVQAYGGGICQVSSTIFAAALFANLEIVERWEHEYVSSYIAAGMDAAVAWNELDLRIVNNTSYPVRLDVDYRDGYLTVTIRGTKTDDAFVRIQTETLDTSPTGMLEVDTYRNVYTENKSQLFTEKIAHSAYLR